MCILKKKAVNVFKSETALNVAVCQYELSCDTLLHRHVPQTRGKHSIWDMIVLKVCVHMYVRTCVCVCVSHIMLSNEVRQAEGR